MQKINSKMEEVCPTHLSINVLNPPFKWQRLTERIKKKTNMMQCYAICKRLTLDPRTQINSE